MEELTSKCINTYGTLKSDDVRLYVIADRSDTYRTWCHMHGINPMNGHKVWFTFQPRQLMGINEGVVILAYGAHQQKWYHELIERAKIANLEIIVDAH